MGLAEGPGKRVKELIFGQQGGQNPQKGPGRVHFKKNVEGEGKIIPGQGKTGRQRKNRRGLQKNSQGPSKRKEGTRVHGINNMSPRRKKEKRKKKEQSSLSVSGGTGSLQTVSAQMSPVISATRPQRRMTRSTSSVEKSVAGSGPHTGV